MLTKSRFLFLLIESPQNFPEKCNNYSPVIAGEINASDEVLAGRLLERALVHVELAEHALPSGWTVTDEAIPAVHANAAVLARLRGALVDVGCAI